ncbi:hypothetical protein [Phenylobacterium aquaticum]|jgi:hypothetical protein|uniref:hypothetical protein n=1 Tax=Phenylobacterium aquaticum TaxID=1763816 RepID=UPI001F5CC50A|nr:hypothetical protein [Phenylobacterium aquaticum]MCI3132996.1 hypothetical protein [Phenylobacterium aquaticum]
MRTIEIDGGACKSVKDFCTVLKDEIRALPGHGNSIEAFVDSMIWGGMSELPPPYLIRVRGLNGGPIAAFIKELSESLGYARMERRDRKGEDIEVMIQLRR